MLQWGTVTTEGVWALRDIRPALSRRYPEIELFDSPAAATDAVRAWKKQLYRKPMFWVALVGYGCGAGVCVAVALMLVRRWVAVPLSMFGGLIGGIAGGIIGGSGVAAATWFWGRRFHRFLRERLLALGVPVCLKCGYDLRGQTEPRCPECGTPFDPALIQP